MRRPHEILNEKLEKSLNYVFNREERDFIEQCMTDAMMEVINDPVLEDCPYGWTEVKFCSHSTLCQHCVNRKL